MWSKNTETFLGCDSDYAEAALVLFGAPFDGTTSYRPGARFGPRAIRAESYGLETYSPYQDRDLEALCVFDGGDLELPFGNSEAVLSLVEATVAGILKDGKTPVMLGGEHLITLGALRPFARRYPGLHVLHLDAHTDLRDDYLGQTLSHATVMRRIWELLGDGKIHQFGIRSGLKEEFQFARAHADLHMFNLDGFAETVKALAGQPVYLSLDLDVLDPSLFPGTGTPEAGGVSFEALLGAILALRETNIVGCDVNELSPGLDASGASTATACKITREILLAIGGQ